MDSVKLAQKISELVSGMKAQDVKVIDLRALSSFTDFFIVCSGTSDRQVCAIADKVVLELKKEGIRPISAEGYERGDWVLVDYADVVLHVFSEEARAHYDLEGFWNRAPHLKAVGRRKGGKTKKAKGKRKNPTKKSPRKIKKNPGMKKKKK